MFVDDNKVLMALRRYGNITVRGDLQINDDIEIKDNMVCVCMVCKKTFLYIDLCQIDGDRFIQLYCDDCI